MLPALTDRKIALILALFSGLIYAVTLCPTIYTGDCGEITTAVSTWGVMHPTGYPLYTLLGGILTHLIPVGEPAWRLGWLSVIPAAMCVSLVFLNARLLGVSKPAASSASLVAAFSYNLWSQATKVETYALNAFFVALLLFLAIRSFNDGKLKSLLILALATGFSLTNHLSISWFLPAVATIAILGQIKHGFRTANIGLALIVFVLPLNLYLYLMYAATHHPDAQVWGNPTTFHNLIDHITGARYHAYFLNPPPGTKLSSTIEYGLKWLWFNVGPIAPLALIGLYPLWKSNRQLFVGLVIGVVGTFAITIVYTIYNISEYFTPLIVLLCICAAPGIDGIIIWIDSRLRKSASQQESRGTFPDPRRSLVFVGTIIASCAWIPLNVHWSVCDRHNQRYVEHFAHNVLSEVPINGVLLADEDTSVFAIWYEQRVLHYRPDVILLSQALLNTNTRVLPYDEWYFTQLDRLHPSLHMVSKLDRALSDKSYRTHEGPFWETLQASLSANQPISILTLDSTDLVAYKGNMTMLHLEPRCSPVREGLILRLYPMASEPSASTAYAKNVVLLNSITPDDATNEVKDIGQEYFCTGIWSCYAQSFATVAQQLENQGKYADAKRWAMVAVDSDPESESALNIYAIAEIESGESGRAIQAWKLAENIDPGNTAYQQNIDKAMRGPNAH